MLEGGTLVAHLLVLLLGTYNQLHATIIRWIVSNDYIAAAVHAQFFCIKSMIKQLILCVTRTKAYGEFALLYAEDLSVFIPQRHQFDAHRFWKIDAINQQDCYVWFGLNPNDLRWLFTSLQIQIFYLITPFLWLGGMFYNHETVRTG
jgi:hypothetical protein